MTFIRDRTKKARQPVLVAAPFAYSCNLPIWTAIIRRFILRHKTIKLICRTGPGLDPVLRLFTGGLACPVQPANPAAAPLSPSQQGTTPPLAGFPRMRIREENCNMVLLAVVTSFSVAIACGATLLGFADNKPVQLADRTTGRVEQAPSPDKRIIYVNDQPQVRVIGAPFIPNTNPRER
ncbi:hypothetical protein [Bradyrhizobium sp. SRL28]|uniref:hypothetical protein n=1 Tax=Bradyrhizobium sp. SRL28 TaxID=2836178 RepID=UPI00201CA179|nr:hypothetical protein [Bradyrhizobium sp. SRL28]